MYLIKFAEIHIFVFWFSFFFALFLSISLTLFISKPDSSRDLTNFMVSFISLFEIISAVVLHPKILFGITVFVPHAAAGNPNRTKTLLAIGVSTFFINGKSTDINGLRKLRNSHS